MTKVEELAKAIGYPQKVPVGAMSFAFVVDGREIAVREAVDGRLVVSCVLAARTESAPYRSADDGRARTPVAPRLLDLAAGRMTKESAVLAWDPEREAVVLWEALESGVGERTVRSFFEGFLMSVDWWMDRVGEADVGLERLSEMVIRP